MISNLTQALLKMNIELINQNLKQGKTISKNAERFVFY